MRDNRLAWEANLSAASTDIATVDFGGPDLQPLTYKLITTPAPSDTVTVTIKDSPDGTNWTDTFVLSTGAAAGVAYVSGVANGRWRKIVATVAGTTSWSAHIFLSVEPAGHYDKF